MKVAELRRRTNIRGDAERGEIIDGGFRRNNIDRAEERWTAIHTGKTAEEPKAEEAGSL
jgi:hypothetical protein